MVFLSAFLELFVSSWVWFIAVSLAGVGLLFIGFLKANCQDRECHEVGRGGLI